MLLTYTYVFLAFFFRRLFDSLVIDPDPPAKKTHQEETDALREEVKQVLGDVGLTGFIRKLVVSINLISDIMIVVGILLFKFFPSFGIGCIVAGCLVWITIINARFDLSPKEISYSNEEIADPTGIEFKDPKPIEPARDAPSQRLLEISWQVFGVWLRRSIFEKPNTKRNHRRSKKRIADLILTHHLLMHRVRMSPSRKYDRESDFIERIKKRPTRSQTRGPFSNPANTQLLISKKLPSAYHRNVINCKWI